MLPEHTLAFTHQWRWRRVKDPYRPIEGEHSRYIPSPFAHRFGDALREVARGRNGNLLIEFEDGERVVAPRHTIRRRPGAAV